MIWRMRAPNKPDAANRRQPLGFREFLGESGALVFTAAVADPFRWATREHEQKTKVHYRHGSARFR